MRQYNCLQALVMAFYSRKFYRDIFAHWSYKAVLAYMVLLLSLCIGIVTFFYQSSISNSLLPTIASVAEQTPELSITQGALQTPEERAYYIRLNPNDDPLAVVDTTGQHLNLETVPAKLLLIKSAVLMRQGPFITIYKLPATLNADFKPDLLKSWLSANLDKAWMLIFPSLLILALCYRLFLSLIYALVGRLFTTIIFAAPLPFNGIMKLSMVAFTPTVIVKTLASLKLGIYHAISYPILGGCYAALTLGYLVFALGANETIVPAQQAEVTELPEYIDNEYK